MILNLTESSVDSIIGALTFACAVIEQLPHLVREEGDDSMAEAQAEAQATIEIALAHCGARAGGWKLCLLEVQRQKALEWKIAESQRRSFAFRATDKEQATEEQEA